MNQELETSHSIRGRGACEPTATAVRSLHRTRRALSVSVILFPLLVLCSAAPSSARVWHVPAQIPGIQMALDIAAPGDTVSVAAGLYHVQNPITMHRPRQTLMSEIARKTTILGENYDVLIIINAAGCALTGLNLYQDIITVVQVTDNCVDVTIAGNTIEGGAWGDGLLIFGTHTIVRGNELRNLGVEVYMPAAVIEDNYVNGVGGIFAYADCTIRRNSFVHCYSGDDMGNAGHGAAIFAASLTRPIVIEDNLFSDCVTINFISDPDYPPSGGAVYLDGCASAQISHNRFMRNQATLGGGLYARNSNVQIHGNLFHANTDSSYVPENPGRGRGGAIYLDNCSGLVDQNTVAHNVAMIDGGGVFVTGPLSPALEQNIYYRNRSAGAAVSCANQASPAIRCCDAFWNSGADYGGTCAGAGGGDENFIANPYFCDEFAPEPDYSLRRDSPCMPDHSPPGCGLVGAYGVGYCSQAGVGDNVASNRASTMCIQPNPCSGQTVISLRGVRLDHVLIEIHDAGGRRVRSARVTSMTWDGRDDQGRPVGDGVYFVRAIRNDGKEIARRALVLIR